MRVSSVSNTSFNANPTGVAKNAGKAIKQMKIYGGATVAAGTLGAVSIISGLGLLTGFTWLLPTFCFGHLYNESVKDFEKLEKPYNEIKQRAKKIYG